MEGRLLSAEEEFTELKARAEAGDASAMHELYLAYLDGFGTEKDEDTAFLWLSRFCSHGGEETVRRLHGIRDLGIAYMRGIGTDKNPGLALECFGKALGQGDKEAAGWIYALYADGTLPARG
ncbi:MAG: sel1 repeat family protein [Treponema sp.]|nr:sel1 repeat family protein [Treponema sp.]